MKKGWILIVFLLLRLSVSAQIDREFYFAVPYITPSHADRPIYLHFTSFSSAATIKVKFAHSGVTLFTLNVPAFTSRRLDVSQYIDVMSATHDAITNYGLYISSTADITAYYELLGSSIWGEGVNSEIFVLKGKKATGTTFYIPIQTYWDNYPLVDGWTSFDIIATENNTSVTITPTQDLLGHAAGVPFTILLQKGQVYSARSGSALGSLQPSGSKVTSDKPIAITLKHDSIIEDLNYDTAGDQLVPVDYIGSEYVAIKASGAANFDRVFIIATEDNTDLYISGNPTPVKTLNESESFTYQLVQNAEYIKSSHPVYVFHVAGFGKELAGALLPPIVCTGSKDVSFARATSERFSLGLLVQAGGEDDFVLNGNATLISPGSFAPVPGLAGWMYALIDFSTYYVEVDVATRLVNTTSDFQMAFMNGQQDFTGFRYGIFSDYGGVELGPDVYVCPGQQFTLDAGYGKDSYLWTPGGDQTQTLVATDSAWYYVTVSKGTCQYEDSVYLGWHPTPITPVLGPDRMVCTGSPAVVFSALNSYANYRWSNGSTQASIQVSDSGSYRIEVKNTEGCSARDTVHLGFFSTPEISITPAQNGKDFCDALQVSLSVTPGYDQYLWYNGETTTSVLVPHTPDDVYSVKVTSLEGCSTATQWSTDCSVYIDFIPNLVTVNDDGINEAFWVEGLTYSRWALEVYDRWGSRVYFNKSYQNNWYPRNIPADIYFYRLYHTDYDELEYKGWVQVVH